MGGGFECILSGFVSVVCVHSGIDHKQNQDIMARAWSLFFSSHFHHFGLGHGLALDYGLIMD
jgi:hypothetical protein